MKQYTYTLQFLNNGELVLELFKDSGYKYMHSYDDMHHAAKDLKLFLAGDDIFEWDGNELDDCTTMVREAKQARQAIIFRNEVPKDAEDHHWRNIVEFSRIFPGS